MTKAIRWLVRCVCALLVAAVLLDLTVYTLHTDLHDVLQTAADSLEKTYYLPNIVLLVIGTAFLILLMKLPLPAVKKRTIWILSAVFLIIKVYVSYLILFKTNWDAGFLYSVAYDLCNGIDMSNGEYFSWFPNNIIALAFFRLCIAIGQTVGIYSEAPGLVLIMALNSLMVLLGGVLTYDLAEYFADCSTAVKTWIIYVLFVATTPWTMIPYTDSLGFIFPVLVLWCYVRINDEKLTVLKWMLIVIFTYWGYKIKGPALLVFAALLVYEIICAIKRKRIDIKKLAAVLVSTILVIAISSMLLSVVIRTNVSDYDKDKDSGVGFLIMVGLSPWNHGTFNEFDYGMLTRYPNKDEFDAEVKSRIIERIRSYGPKGLAVHQLIKTMIVFNDGTFAWGAEGDFYKEPLSEKNPILTPFFKNVFWNDGKYFEAYATVMQILWIALIFGMLLYAILSGDEKDESLILLMSVILMILFAESVESRARYLYTFAPIFCVTGMLGMERLSRIKMNGRKNGKE